MSCVFGRHSPGLKIATTVKWRIYQVIKSRLHGICIEEPRSANVLNTLRPGVPCFLRIYGLYDHQWCVLYTNNWFLFIHTNAVTRAHDYYRPLPTFHFFAAFGKWKCIGLKLISEFEQSDLCLLASNNFVFPCWSPFLLKWAACLYF